MLGAISLIVRDSKHEARLSIHDTPLCQVQGEIQRDLLMQDVPLLETEFFCTFDVSSWFFMTIAKNWSTLDESLVL